MAGWDEAQRQSASVVEGLENLALSYTFRVFVPLCELVENNRSKSPARFGLAERAPTTQSLPFQRFAHRLGSGPTVAVGIGFEDECWHLP